MTPQPDVTERLDAALAGRYRIEREIGEGGMATVYLAHDIKHDRKVALKVLRPELAALIGGERFLQEIRVTANLQHPHILPLHDSGKADGFFYYVMPYVEGESLRERLKREKQLAIDEAVELARGIASALDYAHRQGVVHRDIKPENILLHDRQPLVADFGIALAFSQAGGTRLTETGLSLGTPQYMSPEQAMGDRELDARTDIYSLGAVLFEMLAGDPPYTGSTGQAIVAKVLTEPVPSVTVARPTAPPNVAAAAHKALAKLPADRFHSAAELAEALGNPSFRADVPAAGIQLAGAPAGAGGRAVKLWVAVAAAAALAAVAAAAAWWLHPEPAPSPATRFVVNAPEGVYGTGQCCGTALALSPDGSELVYVGGGPEIGTQLFRRSLNRLETEPIPGAQGAAVPFFSPDGAWVGFEAEESLRKVALAGGPTITIAGGIGDLAGASWGDGDVILFATDADSALWRVSANGGEPEMLVAPDSAGTRYAHPEILPGGRRALLTVLRGRQAEIGVVSLESGELRILGVGTEASYAHPNRIMYTGGDGSLLVRPFDPGAGRATGPAVALLDGVILRDGIVGEFAVSRSGTLAYLPGEGGEVVSPERLVWIQRDGTTQEIREPAEYEYIRISPDGRRVAMWLESQDTEDIWVYDIDQRTTIRLTFEGGIAPLWTPDGEWIVFSSDRAGPLGVYRIRADGSGSAEPLLSTGRPTGALDITPDGRTLVLVQTGATTEEDILTFAMEGDGEPRVYLRTPFDEAQPALSPDGRWLAYTSDESGQDEVYVSAFPERGAKHQVSTGGGNSPRWSPDGRELYYMNQDTMTAATVAVDDGFRVESREALFVLELDLNSVNTNYDIHPDGDRFLGLTFGGASAGPRLVVITNWMAELERLQTARR